MDDFVDWLRQTMDERGVKQADFVRAGLNSGLASQIYNGSRRPGTDSAQIIGRVLGISAEDVLRRANKLGPSEQKIDDDMSTVLSIMRRVNSSVRKRILRYAIFSEKENDESNQENPSANKDEK